MTRHIDPKYSASLAPLITALVLASPNMANMATAQGCITARGSGGLSQCSLAHGHETAEAEDKWLASVSYRWFRSERMFSGTSEDPTSDPQINRSHFIDVSLRYNINARFGATVTLPYVSHDRSQVVRRLNLARTILGEFHTKASGLGDIRIGGDAWLLDPARYSKGNIRLGLGLGLPTGDRDAQGTFAVGGAGLIPSAVVRTLDPSIMPGSGGFGVSLDLYAYREVLPRLNGFLSGTYTFTPEEDYAPTISSVAGYTTYSIADSYIGRAGFEYMLWSAHSLSFSLAGRIEGVPVSDPLGGSGGFRRPGYMVSIEPGLMASLKRWSFSVSAPVTALRNRIQNNTERGANLPAEAAGFADFQIIMTVSKRF